MRTFPRLATVLWVLAIFRLAWRICGFYLKRYFTRKTTVVYELEDLGKARPDEKKIKGTAVICGGSIAGLWTARVAADHFEDVVLVEPEAWLDTEEGQCNIFGENGMCINKAHTRTRVTQYDCLHVFQPLAFQALRKFFPNAEEEIRKGDGRIAGLEYNAQVYGRHILRLLPKHEYPDGKYPQVFYMSRDMYERTLRRLVFSSSKRVRRVVGTATGVQHVSGDPTTLSSVTVRLADGAEQNIRAALVIDCTGGTQAGLKWVRRIASEPANIDVLQKHVPAGALLWDDLRIVYSTAQRYIVHRFTVPHEVLHKLPIPGGAENNFWPISYIPIPRVERKIYWMSRTEGNRYALGFGGWGEPEVPMDPSEIKDWFKGLEVDHQKAPEWIYRFVDALLEYKTDYKVISGRYPDPAWIRYERAPFVPSNFIAIGDAVMSANPTFGQGCSKATIGAITLDGILKKAHYANSTTIPSGFGREFFKVHKDKIESIWTGAKSLDYMWDTTKPIKGEKNSDEWLAGNFSDTVMALACTDKEVDAALYKVRNFMAPETALLAPKILVKILFFVARKKLGFATL